MCACVWGWVHVCVYPCPVGTCVCVCLSILESSAGVGDRDNGGAQSEQGGQEMGNQSGQGTQKYHSLQESKMDTNILMFVTYTHFRNTTSERHMHTVSNQAMCLCVLLSVFGGV